MPATNGAALASKAVWLDRRTPPHIVSVVLVVGIAAVNLNVVLPALPSLAADFQADYAVVALSVSGYLALTGVLQLLLGPLSDRFGRRPVLLASGAVFLVASLGCMVAPTLAIFLACRMAQSAIASGLVLSRAIVRDMVPADQAASLLGYVTMGMSLMPMVAPMIGGALDEAFGWRSIFLFTFLAGALAMLLIWADLGETNVSPSTSLLAQMHDYPALLRSRPYWGFALTSAFASGLFYGFLGGGPWVATELLHMSPTDTGFYFGFPALGYLFGNLLSGRYAARVGLAGMMLAGSVVATLAVLLALGIFAVGTADPISFFGAIALTGFGNGLLLPSANAGIVSVRPDLAGSASGLGGALNIGLGAALAVLGGIVVGPQSGAWLLLLLMFASSALSILTTLDVMRCGRREGLPL